MTTKDNFETKQQICRLFPQPIRNDLAEISDKRWSTIEEIRLRVGYPVSVVTLEGEVGLAPNTVAVTSEHLKRILEIATHASVHSALSQINRGYFTVEGGHRIGICGKIQVNANQIWHVNHISSLSVRIARETVGEGGQLLTSLLTEAGVHNTMILGPPGSGKTTLLRTFIRCLSDGIGQEPLRVGVADERSELCGMWQGIPQFSIGCHTDVLDGCPKDEGLMALLRGMNPQVLAVDEITHPKDVEALEIASHCGVALLATAHGSGVEDLRRRPLYRKLLAAQVFTRGII